MAQDLETKEDVCEVADSIPDLEDLGFKRIVAKAIMKAVEAE